LHQENSGNLSGKVMERENKRNQKIPGSLPSLARATLKNNENSGNPDILFRIGFVYVGT
jgi:hypothetical protein